MGFPLRDAGVAGHRRPELAGLNLNTVERREFFAASAAAGAAALGIMPAGRSWPPLTAGAPVGAAHVRKLRAALANLYVLDDAYGGADVRPLAVRLLRRIRRVINACTYPDTIGRQLQLAAGHTAEHCGWLSFDAGRQHDASRFWGEALTTATVLHDEQLEIVALASLSLQARYENRPKDACDLARAAQERAGGKASPTVLSILAAREAHALARMQDHPAARRTLARSMRLLEQGNKGQPAPDWASFHGPAELSYVQGLLYAEAGHHHAARPYIQAALAQLPTCYGRNRVLYRLALADSMIRSGDVDAGCAEVLDTATDLDEIGSGRVRRQIKAVKNLLASIDATPARETADQLNQVIQHDGHRQ